MIVRDKINEIEKSVNYVIGSVCMKSYDDTGCVFKYLEMNESGTSDRRELFLGTDKNDRLKIIFDRTIISEAIVNNPI